MFGPQSPNWLLITGPRLTAGSQSLSSEARCETQMSFPPCPPGLFEQKYRLSASGESVGPCSLKAVLTASPRRTGSDQSSRSEERRVGKECRARWERLQMKE